MKKALKPGGIVCSQGSSFWIDIKHVQDTVEGCRRQFKNTSYAMAMVPSYPCGSIGFVIGCLDEGNNLNEPIHKFTKEEIDRLGFRYYTSEIHKASFSLPRFAEKALGIS